MSRQKRNCKIEDCEKPSHGQGLCGTHYRRFQRSEGFAPAEYRGVCSVDHCDQTAVSLGYCNLHYKRIKRNGTPHRIDTDDIEGRIRSKSHIDPTGCILWTGAVNSKGYGQIVIAGESILVHRVVWSQSFGPIPDRQVIDHFGCYTPACINPSHLIATTSSSNNFNRQGANRNNTSGYRNVSFSKDKKKWYVVMAYEGRRRFGGYFNTAEEANLAAVDLRNKTYSKVSPNGE